MEPRSVYFDARARGEEPLRLHALCWGDANAPPVVLLHGGGANAHWWDHLADAFSDRFFVVALDFRGHGDSDHPDSLRVGAFDDDLESLLEHLGRPEVFLVGHSMGAAVALRHATRSLGVRGLVLIDIARGGARRSSRATRLALALRRSYRSRDEAIERYRFFPPAEGVDESLRRTIASHSVRREPDGRFVFKFDPRWFTLPAQARPETARVRCPTLLIRGAASALLSAEGAARWLEEIPDARLVEVPEAGHHVQLERPGPVRSAMAEFLDAVVARSAGILGTEVPS